MVKLFVHHSHTDLSTTETNEVNAMKIFFTWKW